MCFKKCFCLRLQTQIIGSGIYLSKGIIFLQICGNSCRDLETVATKHNIAQSPNPTNRYTKTTEFKNNKHTYTKKALLIKTLLPRIFRTKRIMNTKSYGLESNFSIPSSYPSGQSSIPDFSGLSRDSC